jgi:nitrite reductase/ring-hydroxylating ferredoxin subunit
MQSFDTNDRDSQTAIQVSRTIVIGRLEDLPVGSRKTVELPNEREIALYNINGEINGEIYAIENSCPHKGAPLSEGILCDRVVECDCHGWQFDLRSGECLTVSEKIETYQGDCGRRASEDPHLESDRRFAISHLTFFICHC